MGLWTHPKVALLDLPEGHVGPFITLGDGSLMTVRGNATQTSADGGKSWTEPRTIYTGKKPGIPGPGVLLRTREGTIVLVYIDRSTFIWGWNDETGSPDDGVRADVWSIRSPDEGKTWFNRQRILEGYCGALINMIETERGPIVVGVQALLDEPARHAQKSLVSYDQGKSWSASHMIDLGGHGHHDGAMEGTVVELKDRRLWMLIRTNLDRFWSAFSTDYGESWRSYGPSEIDASSSPGQLLRLASGRLVLAWNRLYPEGADSAPMESGQYSEVEAIWQRGELSLAFSDDEGSSWGESTVVARADEWISYPYLFEYSPGELWVRAGEFRGVLKERDFVG
jgi:sialidase-1